jgi:hypothetical protein
MPFDPKSLADAVSTTPDDAEESGEQDAVTAAFDAIRASIDAAEQSLMMDKFKKPDDGADDSGPPMPPGKGA